MRLRIKVPLIISAIIIVSLIALSLLYSGFLVDGFVRIEQANVKKDIDRVQNAYLAQIDYLQSKIADWSNWDETFEFIQNKNPEYPEINVTDIAIETLHVNVMMFVNNDGHIVHERWYDPVEKRNDIRPTDIDVHLTPDSYFFTRGGPQQTKSGIILLKDNPILLVAHTISDSTGEAPSVGTILFGVFIDKEVIDNLGRTTNLVLSAYSVNQQNLPSEILALKSELEQNPQKKIIKNRDAAIVEGYGIFSDYTGKGALLFKIDVPRTIYAQAQITMRIMLLIGAAATVLVIIVTFILSEKLILQRLLRLAFYIDKLKEQKDLSKPIPSDNYHDEISSLTDTLNSLLVSIQEYQQKLRGSKEEIERMNSFMIDRELKMSELKKKVDELESKTR